MKNNPSHNRKTWSHPVAWDFACATIFLHIHQYMQCIPPFRQLYMPSWQWRGVDWTVTTVKQVPQPWPRKRFYSTNLNTESPRLYTWNVQQSQWTHACTHTHTHWLLQVQLTIKIISGLIEKQDKTYIHYSKWYTIF